VLGVITDFIKQFIVGVFQQFVEGRTI